jgi:hypothetical protein
MNTNVKHHQMEGTFLTGKWISRKQEINGKHSSALHICYIIFFSDADKWSPHFIAHANLDQ